MEVKKSKILLIDDDLQYLKECSAYLEKLGYEVATAEDGRTGLKLAQELNPNLVVLDLIFPDSIQPELPALDGMEVLLKLREAGNVPVIILSSTTISSVKKMALFNGANDYMYKPFDLQELSGRISTILNEETTA